MDIGYDSLCSRSNAYTLEDNPMKQILMLLAI